MNAMATRLPSDASLKYSANTHDTRSISQIDLDRYSPVGDRPCLIVNLTEASDANGPACTNGLDNAVLVGVETSRRPVETCLEPFDVLLTTVPGRGRPFIEVAPTELDATVSILDRRITSNPAAASILCQVLRAGGNLPYDQALILESLAYSTLLGGGEFRTWLEGQSIKSSDREHSDKAPILIDRVGDRVSITLNNASERNAMSAIMRDALFEALAAVVEDPTEPEVVVQANGKCFSVGGELSEFGLSDDLVKAHTIRSLRSCTRLLASLGKRASVRVHGACIGSGIEIAAAAMNRYAATGTFIQLPEVSMGLIPGAGGTVSLARAIGRHRTAYLALSGKRFRAERLSGWGLFNSITAPSPCR